MRLRIDLKIFIFILLFILTNQIKIYAIIMLFAIIHEMGHLVTGMILGMKPDKIELTPFGVSINFKITQKEYNKRIRKGNLLELKKIFIAVAGPLTNFIIILLTNNLNINFVDKKLIIYANIILILFNILPIYPLDGGRIIKGILHIIVGKYKTEKYVHNISYITLVILTILSNISILYLKNIAIFLVIMFLWGLEIKENKIYENRQKIYEAIKTYDLN